jgi:hypothetical protein
MWFYHEGEIIMKKQSLKLFVMSFLFAIIGVFSSNAVFAQSNPLEVEVPFNFYVGNEKLSAGKYQIQRIRDNVFLLGKLDGKAKVLAQTPTTIDAAKEVISEKLVFNRYGDKYFLRQIFTARATVGRALYESKSEKNVRQGLDNEMEAKNAKPQQVEVSIK